MTTTNKVIKNCVQCGVEFEDKTRPKNKKTCSRKCADEARKERQRIQYRIDNPKKPTQREIYYHEHLEYPFWSDCSIGDNHAWKYVVPYAPNKIEAISAAKQRYEAMGGRKRNSVEIDEDNENTDVIKNKVNVRFAEHEHKQASEVVTYTLSEEELARYNAM